MASSLVLADWEGQEFLERRFREMRGDYPLEVKFTRLGEPRAFSLAKRWLEFLLGEGGRWLSWKAFLTDLEGSQRLPYPGDPEWPENLSQNLLTTFTSGLVWRYPWQDRIKLHCAFDGTDNEIQRAAQRHLPTALQARFFERNQVTPRLYAPIERGRTEWIDSRPPENGHPTLEQELIQLADVLIGAAVAALLPQWQSHRRKGRIQFAQSVLEIMEQQLQVPWLQTVPIHRRLSVSIWPDEFHFAYPAKIYRDKAEKTGTQRGFRWSPPPLAQN